jgi:hypothetical protein
MKRNRVVWSSSADPTTFTLPPRRTRRFRRAIRTGALLVVIGLMRLAGHPRWRSAVIGAALVIPGVILRGSPGGIILLPGLLILFSAPLMPGESRPNRVRHARLYRELAAYSTPAQRRDLEAIIDRYPDDETRELRAILARQATTATAARIPGFGRY